MSNAEVTQRLCELLNTDQMVPLSGGRTNLVFQSGKTVVKCYRPQPANPMFGNFPDREWQILSHLKPHSLAPDPIARHQINIGPTEIADVLIYAILDGPSGFTMPDQAAQILGRIHTLNTPDGLAKSPVGQEVTAHGHSMIGPSHPLEQVCPPAPTAPRTLSLIHRDPVPTNFIQTQDGLRLIDWQCPALGDPVEDIAHALSPAMHMLYSDRPLTKATWEAFITAYPDAKTVDRYRAEGLAFHWRMACYCAWKVAQGVDDYRPALTAETRFLETQAALV